MKNFFLRLYFNLTFWLEKAKIKRQLDKEFRLYGLENKFGVYQRDTERKYAEGMYLIKSKVNSLTTNGSEEDFQQVLKEIHDLFALAKHETPRQKAVRETLEKLYVRSGKDVKSRRDKKEMIKQRIQHYEELRQYNLERALIKQIKQAKKESNHQLAKELEEEWKNKYVKNRVHRRR